MVERLVDDFTKAARKAEQEYKLRTLILGHADTCLSQCGASTRTDSTSLRKRVRPSSQRNVCCPRLEHS